MRNILVILIVSFGFVGFSQELNCNIVVNAQQTGNENLQIYKTLEKQLNEFVNSTKWTNKTFAPQERISCSMFINVGAQNGEIFQASLQIQSSRPVYGSSYTTPLYNFNDRDFNFPYLEFQNLIYNPTQFESNLVSVLAFHINIILGLDADSFAPNGGDVYFKQAQTILNYSQQENYQGWKLADGLQSRFALIDNLLSPTYSQFRDILYAYHRKGMDAMSESTKTGKEQISTALRQFQILNNGRPNSFLVRTFFDAKADEIEQIFSSGPNVNVANLIEVLQKVAPTHNGKWQNIRF